MASLVLPPESASLSPLPEELRSGLTVVATLAAISLATSTALFTHLTYKLLKWSLTTRRTARIEEQSAPPSPGIDLALGLAERHFIREGEANRLGLGSEGKRNPNQFLILFYNLLMADMHQALAFLVNAVWVSGDALVVGSSPCWIQGWFVSIGDLSASLFISLIAIHTYCTIVRGIRPPHWTIFGACAGIWIFSYGMTAIGPISTHNGRDVGGFYVRAAAWCWINEKHENLRLTTHYLFIFISLALTSILYILIFFSLRAERPTSTLPPSITHSTSDIPNFSHHQRRTIPSKSSSSLDLRPSDVPPSTGNPTATRLGGHHPAFLIYPVIYVICTSPLAVGRIATMAGAHVPLGYFCAAGALITSNGWLDVLLWGSTRRSVVFGAVDEPDIGIDTFSFMRTPHNRRYGNMVWVEGARGKGDAAAGGGGGSVTGAVGAVAGLWESVVEWVGARARGRGGRWAGGEGSVSQQSLRGVGAARADRALEIQLDRVTTVVVEVEVEDIDDKDREAARSSRSRDVNSYASSARSGEKEFLSGL